MGNDRSRDIASGEEGEQMDLLYLLLPIIGAFLMLFVVCCCGKKVKEILHMPKELAISGRLQREIERLTQNTPQHQQPSSSSEARQRCASGQSHTQIECTPTSEDAASQAMTIQMDSAPTAPHQLPVHPLQAPCCSNKRYIGDVTEQELEALLAGDDASLARLRHDSGIASCSCHRSLMSIEVGGDPMVIREEGSCALQKGSRPYQDKITVIEQVNESPDGSCATPDVLLGSCSHPRPCSPTRRMSEASSSGKKRLHQSLCEGLQKVEVAPPCPCSASGQHHHALRYAVSFDCHAENGGSASQPTDVITEDSRRRHLSVGSCDTAKSDIIVHVVSDAIHISDSVDIVSDNVQVGDNKRDVLLS